MRNTVPQKTKVLILQTSKAIKKSIEQAEPGETILVAGKGHEEIQIYKNKIYRISDKKIIKKLKIKIKNFKKKNIIN